MRTGFSRFDLPHAGSLGAWRTIAWAIVLAAACFTSGAPLSAAVDFRQSLTLDPQTSPPTLTYTWHARSGFRYVVLTTPDLVAPWVQLPLFIATGSDVVAGVNLQFSETKLFLRVFEFSARGWSEMADTDADGLPDAWEIAWFGNLTATSAGDPDNDGLSNLAEFHLGGDPNRAPTPAISASLGLRLALPAP